MYELSRNGTSIFASLYDNYLFSNFVFYISDYFMIENIWVRWNDIDVNMGIPMNDITGSFCALIGNQVYFIMLYLW